MHNTSFTAEPVVPGPATDARRAPACFRPLVLLLPVLLLTGCVNYNFNRVQIGQGPRDYQRAFPVENLRSTALGLCYFEERALGRTDAVVILLTPDRRVAGKLHAAHVEGSPGLVGTGGFRLTGELHPGLAKLSGAGPIDTLRTVADDLTREGEDTFVRTAHSWIAAGLVRLIQQWPHTGDEGPAVERVSETLERIAPRGAARISIDPRGVYVLEYAVGKAP